MSARMAIIKELSNSSCLALFFFAFVTVISDSYICNALYTGAGATSIMLFLASENFSWLSRVDLSSTTPDSALINS